MDMDMPKQIDVHELAAMQQAKEPVYLLDVRQPWEHAIAALSGSVLIPLGELAERIGEVRPPEGALIVAYCHHGVRSLDAAAFLAARGHRVASLAGGIDRWSRAVDDKIVRY